jgi:hypothetical protein
MWSYKNLKSIRRSDGAPEPDRTLKVVVRKKIIHYLQLYIDRVVSLLRKESTRVPVQGARAAFLSSVPELGAQRGVLRYPLFGCGEGPRYHSDRNY